MSWYRAPLWDLRPDITSCRNVPVWNLRSYFCGAPSLMRGRVCNLQCNHPLIRVTQTRNHTLLSHLRLPQPGGPGSRIYIPQGQGGPVIPPGTGFPFRRLLRLAGLRWRYCNPPPHGPGVGVLYVGGPDSNKQLPLVTAQAQPDELSGSCCRAPNLWVPRGGWGWLLIFYLPWENFPAICLLQRSQVL
jgi:hypothetical protein